MRLLTPSKSGSRWEIGVVTGSLLKGVGKLWRRAGKGRTRVLLWQTIVGVGEQLACPTTVSRLCDPAVVGAVVRSPACSSDDVVRHASGQPGFGPASPSALMVLATCVKPGDTR